eukprot:TRINITY_DN55824_c0_g1_i1.p1 TRINITY_DN55824_c0_g1~~TRINITY_DN55824_c0_g1_i1.p1  ORF type:complete len:193 (+),score=34.31 TRINITY_DN55824_c0_g1_i1:74-652(+)
MAITGGEVRMDFDELPAGKLPLPFVHKSLAKFMDQGVFFHTTLFDGSVFLWVGDQRLGLDDLQVSTPTKYDPLPCVATLRGDADGIGSSLAQKLSKRFGMMVYLSYNLAGSSPEIGLFVQKEAQRILGVLLGVDKKVGNSVSSPADTNAPVVVPSTAGAAAISPEGTSGDGTARAPACGDTYLGTKGGGGYA